MALIFSTCSNWSKSMGSASSILINLLFRCSCYNWKFLWIFVHTRWTKNALDLVLYYCQLFLTFAQSEFDHQYDSVLFTTGHPLLSHTQLTNLYSNILFLNEFQNVFIKFIGITFLPLSHYVLCLVSCESLSLLHGHSAKVLF